MQTQFGMSLFINITWLFVGGILTFWIGVTELPWMIVGVLVTLIGVVGINLAFIARAVK
jgi:hypothetical protein